MRTPGTAQELARRRRLAVLRVNEGYSATQVARFLGVHIRTVHRWLQRYRDDGDRGLSPKFHPGPKPRLSIEQDLEVLSWLLYPATSFGFPTALWTAPRIAHLIEEKLGVHFHPRYLNAWLRQRGVTPQKPALRARERDQAKIDAWLATDWLLIKKKPSRSRPTSS